MANFITLIVVVAMIYLIMNVISRKKRELEEKESRQRDQFLQDTQTLLKSETLPKNRVISVEKIPDKTYRSFVSEYFTSDGYSLSESAKQTGIDFLGIKTKELIMIRCDNDPKEVLEKDIKIFIADCAVYIEKNPMLSNRHIQRIYVAPRPLSDPIVLNFIHSNPQSIRFISLRMANS